MRLDALSLEDGEGEARDRLVDQAPLVGLVERLAGDLLRGDQRQLSDLGPDLLERPLRLGLDLAAGVLEAPLPVGRARLADAIPLGVRDAPGLGEDLLGIGAGARD